MGVVGAPGAGAGRSGPKPAFGDWSDTAGARSVAETFAEDEAGAGDGDVVDAFAPDE